MSRVSQSPDPGTHGRPCTAFVGVLRIASGPLEDVAATVKEVVDKGHTSPVLVFDDETSAVIDLDLRGSVETVRRYARQLAQTRVAADLPVGGSTADGKAGGGAAAAGQSSSSSLPASDVREAEVKGPGRPRLGVVAREVTLLPRHWEWLATQPGGASAALRRLVEQARRTHAGRDRIRRAQNAAYRFMSAMAGDEPGFEEAARALFGGNQAVFDALTERWPADVRDHARKLARGAFADEAPV